MSFSSGRYLTWNLTAWHPLEAPMEPHDSRPTDPRPRDERDPRRIQPRDERPTSRIQPRDERPTSRVAVVTGASSGIGAATALRLARGGFTVALVARRPARLTEPAAKIADPNNAGTRSAGTAVAFPADLTDPAARERVISRITADLGPIDVLVNNAGHGYYGAFAAMPWRDAHAMIELNAAAPVHLSGLVLPHMLAAGGGHIVNIGSG